ncbi:MAG: hypothetical protein ACK5MW_06435 [Enterococcus sp.]
MCVNKKIDVLYGIFSVLSVITLLLLFRLWFGRNEMINFFLIPIIFGLPSIITINRRKRRLQKIGKLLQILNVSTSEIRELANLNQYEFWDCKRDKSYLKPNNLYLLEEALEVKYIQKFGKIFSLKEQSLIEGNGD